MSAYWSLYTPTLGFGRGEGTQDHVHAFAYSWNLDSNIPQLVGKKWDQETLELAAVATFDFNLASLLS